MEENFYSLNCTSYKRIENAVQLNDVERFKRTKCEFVLLEYGIFWSEVVVEVAT